MNQDMNLDIDQMIAKGERIFEHGLPNPPGTNTCFINSLLTSLRSILVLVRMVLHKSVHIYMQNATKAHDDLLIQLSMLMEMMLTDAGGIRETNQRENVIRLLVNLARDRQGERPIEENRQGDPNELLFFMKDLLTTSIEQMDRQQQGRQATNQVNDNVAQELRQLVDNITPSISDYTRCQCGEKSGVVNNTFIFLPDQNGNGDQYADVNECLRQFFTPDRVTTQCNSCHRTMEKNKCYRLEQETPKFLVVAFNLGFTVNYLDFLLDSLKYINK